VVRALSRDGPGSRVRLVWESTTRSGCVQSSRSWTWRVHSGTRASWRLLSGATSVRTPSSSPGSQWGHPEADEAFDGPPRAPAVREGRAQAERLAELAQVDHGRTAFAPQHRKPPQDQQRGRADDPGPDLFDVRAIEREPDPPHLRVGVGHRVDGQHLRRFHALTKPASACHPSPDVVVGDGSWAGGTRW
jgi:hypothetical protein